MDIAFEHAHLCKADAFDSLRLSALRTRLRDQAGVQVRAAGKGMVHPAGSEAWQQAGNRWRLKVVLGVPLFFREMLQLHRFDASSGAL